MKNKKVFTFEIKYFTIYIFILITFKILIGSDFAGCGGQTNYLAVNIYNLPLMNDTHLFSPLISLTCIPIYWILGDAMGKIFIGFLFTSLTVLGFYHVSNDERLSFFLFFFPWFTMWIFSDVPEILIGGLAIFAINYYIKKKYNLAFLFSGLCVFAKVTGIMVPLALLFNSIVEKKFKVKYLTFPVIFICLQFIGYQWIYGDWLYHFHIATEQPIPTILKDPFFVLNNPLLFYPFFLDTPLFIISWLSAVMLIKMKNKREYGLVAIAFMIGLSFIVVKANFIHLFSRDIPRYLVSMVPFIVLSFDKFINKYYKYIMPFMIILSIIQLYFVTDPNAIINPKV